MVLLSAIIYSLLFVYTNTQNEEQKTPLEEQKLFCLGFCKLFFV